MRPHPPTPTAIFFDLDDTLINERAASSHGLRALMERLGHPDFPAARALWDIQTELSFSAYIAGRLTLTQQRRERIRALATQAGHPHIADHHCDELYQRYLDAHQTAWQTFDDTTTALTQLAARNIQLGIITNGVQTLQHEKLAATNLTHHFTTIVCADTAGTGKPDPRIFHLACHQLGVPPNQAWHVGDQLRADALGAINAGLHPILCDRHHHAPTTDITTIHTLTELTALLPTPTTGANLP